MRLVDTHCHIDLEVFDADRDAVLERAREAGVDRFIVVGFAPERWSPALALQRGVPGVYAALGLHPTEADRFSEEVKRALRQMIDRDAVVAVGEIGMDYHWKVASGETQRRAFEWQIRLAKERTLPFIVHQREAAEDVLAVLRRSNPPHLGVMHCFTENLEYASKCVDLGLHLGLGGAVTFKKARALHEVVRRIPLDRIVLETDSPFMTPSSHRGERNEPAYTRLVAQRIAELREIPLEEMATATTANAEWLFRLSAPEVSEKSWI
jgi:TatD DNase family protein